MQAMKRKAKKVSASTELTDTRKQRIMKELLTDSNGMSGGKIRCLYRLFLDNIRYFLST